MITWRLMTPRRCVRPSRAAVRSLRDSGKHAMTAVRANRPPLAEPKAISQAGSSRYGGPRPCHIIDAPSGVDGARGIAEFSAEFALAALGGGCDAPPGSGPRLGRPGGSMIGQAASISQQGRRLWFPFHRGTPLAGLVRGCPFAASSGSAAAEAICSCIRAGHAVIDASWVPASCLPSGLRGRGGRRLSFLPHRRGGQSSHRRRPQQFRYQRVIPHRAAVAPAGEHRQPAK
jgi:hypothetical protein